MTELIKTDAVIVGAGPIGLFAVFELGLLDIKAHLIDILPRRGRPMQRTLSGKADLRHSRLSDRQRAGPRRQSDPADRAFHPTSISAKWSRASKVRAPRPLRLFRVRTDNDKTYRVQGRRSLRRAAARFSRRSRRSRASKPMRNIRSSIRAEDGGLARPHVLIVGGGDSALDWTLNLEPVAERITLLHRRDAFRAAPHSVKAMRELVAKGEWISCLARSPA